LFVIFVVFFSCLFVIFSCQSTDKKKKVLPFIGNFDVEYKLVDGKEVTDTLYPTVPFFYFRNQDSLLKKSTDFKGKVWIADFFFTSCPTICPKMTKNLKFHVGLDFIKKFSKTVVKSNIGQLYPLLKLILC
jgi:cytochrome oxidase Cu insertion factor (SCO1/SenC/PrrC family)